MIRLLIVFVGAVVIGWLCWPDWRKLLLSWLLVVLAGWVGVFVQ